MWSRTRGRCRPDRLVQAGEAAAHVNVGRDATGSRDLEHPLDLGHRRARRVGAAESHRHGAFVEATAEDHLHLHHLRVVGRRC
jgi:hypothetical protein